MKLTDIIEQAINEVRKEHGQDEVKLIRCPIVQICANGRHKDITTGKFTK